ncbi:hypothetical protein BLNAU_15220 [Blattamonas nauphoetae]|uniref:Transmembrane protein n=1 Tax=Blattamonas nauphoetae TaxID=2049346 RepID=A0ABQ9XI16_9EUKA|nr:hypothetical protein BLNAU_15220 [Blattamonas nauphoetae]
MCNVVEATNQDNDIFFLTGSLSDLIITNGTALFGSQSTIKLLSTVLRNVTKSHQTSPSVSLGPTRTLIWGSQFIHVSNAIEGTIVPPFSQTNRFYVQNTTFSNGYYEGKSYSTTQHLTDVSNSFVLCQFDSCSSQDDGGSLSASYSALSSNIELNLSECTFMSSKSERSGGSIAVFVDGSSEQECSLSISIKACNFLQSSCLNGNGGGFSVYTVGDSIISGTIDIIGSTFSQNSQANFGGSISSSISTTGTVSLSVDNCYFLSSDASKGGSISHEVILSTSSSFSLQNSNFLHSTAHDGGSLYFIIHNPLTILINDVTTSPSTAIHNGGFLFLLKRNSSSTDSCSITISNLQIVNCSAAESGGFLHFEEDLTNNRQDIIIFGKNIVAADCSSGSQGALFSILHVSPVKLTISNSSFQRLSTEGPGAFLFSQVPRLQNMSSSLTVKMAGVIFTNLTSKTGCLLFCDSLMGSCSIFIDLHTIQVNTFDSELSGALIHFALPKSPAAIESVIKNCTFQRNPSSKPSSLIVQTSGILCIKLTTIIDYSLSNKAMIQISEQVKLNLSFSQFINYAHRKIDHHYQFFDGSVGQDNLILCNSVLFNLHTPTCNGYVMTFDTLPDNVQTLFETCVDSSEENQFYAISDKKERYYSISTEARTIFVDDVQGVDMLMCGSTQYPCRSITYSCQSSSRSPFALSAVGAFQSTNKAVFITSPCMRLFSQRSDTTAEDYRASFAFILGPTPMLHGPNNNFELAYLIFNLETKEMDTVFFRTKQSKTVVSNILINYSGTPTIFLFFISPTTPSTDLGLQVSFHSQKLSNIVLFATNSTIPLIESSELHNLVLAGSSTLVKSSKDTTIKGSLFLALTSTQSPFHLDNSHLVLTTCHFESCEVEASSLVVVDTNSVLTLQWSSFFFCEGQEAGVVLFTETANQYDSKLEQDKFVGNTATLNTSHGTASSSLFGNDLTIRRDGLHLKILNCRSSSVFPRAVVGIAPNAKVVDLFACLLHTVFVDVIGSDTSSCGTQHTPCGSLQYSIGFTNETNEDSSKTTVFPCGHFREYDIEIGNRSVLVDGDWQTEFIVPKLTFNAMFVIRDSAIEMKKVTFDLTQQICGKFISSTSSHLVLSICSLASFPSRSTLTHPQQASLDHLFSTQFGSVRLSQFRTEGFKEYPHRSPLLNSDQTDVCFEHSTLSHLCAASATGIFTGVVHRTHFWLNNVRFEQTTTSIDCGMVCVEVKDEGRVTFEHTTFSNQAILVPLVTISLSSTTPTINQNKIVVDASSLGIEDCVGVEGVGSVLFVKNPNCVVWTLAKSENRMNLTNMKWDSFSEQRGSDSVISLFSSQIPPLSNYHIEVDRGSDRIDCGSEQIPCSSIAFAVDEIYPHRQNAVGVILLSPTDLTAQLLDTKCSLLDGLKHTLDISNLILNTNPAILVTSKFELASIVLSLPPNLERVRESIGVVQCVSGSLVVRDVVVLQTAQANMQNRNIILARDSHVEIRNCELTRITTEEAIVSLSFSESVQPSFRMRNVSFVSCQPQHTPRISLTLSTDHANIKLKSFFSEMKVDWKHPQWYKLKVGNKESSFVFDLVVHPAIWVGIGFGGLVSLFLVPWIVCTPAAFPFLLCCGCHRTKEETTARSRCCLCCRPDGGLGQRDHDPWANVVQMNGHPHHFRYSSITEIKTQTRRDSNVDRIGTGKKSFVGDALARWTDTRKMIADSEHTRRDDRREFRSHPVSSEDDASDTNSEDIFLSSESSDEEEV